MARWQEIVDSAPELAASVRRHLDARVHKTLAIIRADGSPRISGIETFFADDDPLVRIDAERAQSARLSPRLAFRSSQRLR